VRDPYDETVLNCVRRLAAVARKEYDMARSIAVVVVPAFLFIAAGAAALHSSQQYPMMDAIAQKVIQKYQNASCTELMAKKTTPPTDEQAQKRAQAIEAMRDNPGMRQAFIDKVAAPIANKMFDCGMIP
jgi:hypothetical protein